MSSTIMTEEERKTAWTALKPKLEALQAAGAGSVYDLAARLDVPERGLGYLMDGTTKCPTQATLALLTVRLADVERHPRAGVVIQRQGPALPVSDEPIDMAMLPKGAES